MILLLAAVLGIAIAIPGRELYFSLKKTQKTASETFEAVKNQDVDKTSLKIDAVQIYGV